jgi:hypothetical protein
VRSQSVIEMGIQIDKVTRLGFDLKTSKGI